jgi:hypothetical protein
MLIFKANNHYLLSNVKKLFNLFSEDSDDLNSHNMYPETNPFIFVEKSIEY